MQESVRVHVDFPLPEERVFRYQAMQDILHHLVNNPLESFTQQELARMTGADISSVSRSVTLLEELGVLDVEEGVPARIGIDQDHLDRSDPLFAIPQREFRKPVRAYLTELKASVRASEAIERIVGVVLFGSVASGTADRSSDIDLFVVVDGDGTHARRIGTRVARDLEAESFDGDRYQFEVLVETPESATSHGEKLQEIFDEGIVLEQTDQFRAVRDAVYEEGGGD